jgi:hypothetical protein
MNETLEVEVGKYSNLMTRWVQDDWTTFKICSNENWCETKISW